MSIMTVKGEIESGDLGITDMHEHIFLDYRNAFVEPKNASKVSLCKQKISLENLSNIIWDYRMIEDNFFLSDEKVAEEELKQFIKAGGKTIVDPTTVDMGRDPEALLKISRILNLNIIGF